MWGRYLKVFLVLQFALLFKAFSSMSSSHNSTLKASSRLAAYMSTESAIAPHKARVLLYEGTRHSKASCYAKVETYGKMSLKDWYFSVGDDDVKLGFEPEYSEIKNKTIKLTGSFHSFRIGDLHQIPDMLATSQIRPSYDINAELVLEDSGSPRAFSLIIKNKNFMREFPDKNDICHELKLAKYWPCYQTPEGFELRGGWCVRKDLEGDIQF